MRLRMFTLPLFATTLMLGSLLITMTWHPSDNLNVILSLGVPLEHDAPSLEQDSPLKQDVPLIQDAPLDKALQPLNNCENCSAIIKKTMEIYSKPWKKQEGNYLDFRSQLNSECNGSSMSVLTQANCPVGTTMVYSGNRKREFEVSSRVFKTFLKENPFPTKRWRTCSVVGNSGILAGSRCGKQIDSAQFVFRCNLAPLEREFEEHVGKKTDLVTANPSIMNLKFDSLRQLRRPFVERLHPYGSALLGLANYAFVGNTAVCERAIYSIRDFNSPIKPIIFNPDYFYNLRLFWQSRGVKEPRLTTGFLMVSLALELCEDVHLYGFWPYALNPYNLKNMTNHYYDDKKVTRYHYMPTEFSHLLMLHSLGVLRIHLGECKPEGE